MTSTWTLDDISHALDLIRKPLVVDVLECLSRGDRELRSMRGEIDPAVLASALSALADEGAITHPGAWSPGELTSGGRRFLYDLGWI